MYENPRLFLTPSRRVMRPVAATLCMTLLLASCGDISNFLEPSFNESPTATVEGMRVEGTISLTAQRVTSNGTEEIELPVEAFSSVVRSGHAGVTYQPMVPTQGRAPAQLWAVAKADYSDPVQVITRTGFTPDGQRADGQMTFEGRRLKSIVLQIAGRTVFEGEVQWEKRGDLYISTGRTFTLTKPDGTVLRLNASLDQEVHSLTMLQAAPQALMVVAGEMANTFFSVQDVHAASADWRDWVECGALFGIYLAAVAALLGAPATIPLLYEIMLMMGVAGSAVLMVIECAEALGWIE